jgi:tricorn protease
MFTLQTTLTPIRLLALVTLLPWLAPAHGQTAAPAAVAPTSAKPSSKSTEPSGGIPVKVTPDMMGAGITRFVEGFFPQFTKPALLIDARDNHGGYASQLLLARLGRKAISYDRPRRGAMTSYPQATHVGPKAVLINQHAGSDGDIFPSSFKAMGLGPLIGERTWGGVIGIRSDKPFVDGGMATQPEFAWWSPDRGWAIENHGVDPDIEVNYSPADYLAGKDAQLAKGVDELMAELAMHPSQRPQRPADPDRTRPPGQ